MILKKPLIYAWVADLFFTSRIESIVRRLDFDMALLENAPAPGSPTIVETVLAVQPAMIIVDMNHTAIPWQSWVRALKEDPRTQRIPVIAFGSHKDIDAMKAAKQAGADQVLARSRFTSDIAGIIQTAL